MDIYSIASKMVIDKLSLYMADKYALALPESATCTVPPSQELGELATNAAMTCAKLLRKNPRAIAEEFCSALSQLKEIKSAEIAGAGFINIRLVDTMWDEFLSNVNIDEFNYGNSVCDTEEKINIEFVSANPTGPLHVGHCRGAILGNSLSIILKKAGKNVTKEYYVNDHGNQIHNLVRSVQYRYRQLCGLDLDKPLPDECYPGSYITDYAKVLFAEQGTALAEYNECEFFSNQKQPVVNSMLSLIRDDLKGLGIIFDIFSSESALVDDGRVNAAMDRLGKMGLTYKGKIPRPIEAVTEGEDYENEQLLFQSSLFGDSSDRVVVKANGELTYFASDIAYHFDKYSRGYTRLVDIWGADHVGYIPRMQSALSAITEKQAKLDVLLCQMVNLEKDGEPFKMSKRAGTYVLLSDVLQEIDPDIFKIYMLSRNPESQVTFDLVKLTREAQGSIVFYIQYAFARTNSLLQKFEQTFGTPFDCSIAAAQGFYSNANKEEKALLNSIACFPSILRTSADKLVTHLIVNYISDLSGQFHSYWNTGKRIIVPENKELSMRNLSLVYAIRSTLGSGLTALGVEPRSFLSKKEPTDE